MKTNWKDSGTNCRDWKWVPL